MQLKGQTALITGAGSGMGRACALLFAREGAATVIVDYRMDNAESVCREIVEFGGMATAVQCDISQEEEVMSMVDDALSLSGKIDILINAAGISSVGEFKRLHETSYSDWMSILNTNLTGTFLCSKYVLPHMMSSNNGNIVNFGSTYSFLAAPKLGAYAATKGGIIQLTKNIAIDYASYNIRANAICPGFIDTPLLNTDVRKNTNPEAEFENIKQRTMLKRLGTAEEMAETVLFLVSDKASYYTGATLVSDGGYSIV